MNVKMLLTITSVISVLYGIAFVLAPATVDAQFGVMADAPNILSGRFLGATLVSLGLVVWFVRETSDRATLRGLLIGLSVGNALGVLVAIWGTVTRITNGMGWSTVVIFGVLLVGYVYYLFTDPTLVGRN
jgi:hypothetical protein